MAKTTIEWTDFSINPFKARNLETGAIGHWCEKISAGCKHCYASRLQSPYLTQIEYRADNRSKVELFFDDKAIEQVLRRKKPTRYFWCDMTDMFLADYPDEWIDRCFAAMALTPQHTHMVPTKRAERMRKWFAELTTERMMDGIWAAPTARGYSGGWPLPNVWMGVSVETQATADQRIPHLLRTPAAVRFLSCEPLLEQITLWKLRSLDYYENTIGYETYPLKGIQAMPDCDWNIPKLDWVIAGAESGPGARPAEIEWFRQIKHQCVAAKVPFFLKQYAVNGKKIPLPELDGQQWTQIPEVQHA